MGRMSDLHAGSAPDRADAAERDADFLRIAMRLAASECAVVAEVIRATASPNSVIATDMITRLNRVVTSLRTGAGPDPDHPELDHLYAGRALGEEVDVEG